ncbi:MAG: M28 family peptidase [Phycisphaerae bacterium]
MLIEETMRQILSFGPRAVGSNGEKLTADFLADQFRQANLKVLRQEFLASRFPLFFLGKVIPLISIGVLLTAASIYLDHPVIAAVLLLLFLAQATLISFLSSLPAFPDWGKKLKSANIIGRTHPVNDQNPTLILVAHYDSKSQTLPLIIRMVCVILPIVCCAILLVLMLLTIGMVSIPHRFIIFLYVLAVVFLILQIASRNSNRSSGAIDNASGVTILLTMAAELPSQLAGKANLIFLASGAEELSLTGAKAFIRTYSHQLNRNRSLIINFDSMGTGAGVIMVGSRSFKKNGQVAQIRNLFRQAGLGFRFIFFMIGAGMDHIPFSRAGFSAMSFTQTSLRSGLRIHSAADRLEYVNTEQLTLLTKVFGQLIARFYKTAP